MPLYEYACRSCTRSFEEIRKYEERLSAPACPECGSPETVLRLSVPGFVGAGSAGRSGDLAPCGMPASEAGGCCGGQCMH
jgi:putative FmdB family regulatory protein